MEIANKNIHFNKDDKELYSQMGTFICKISKTKKLTFAAQDGKKDDMIMATAIELQCKEDLKNYGRDSLGFVNNGLQLVK